MRRFIFLCVAVLTVGGQPVAAQGKPLEFHLTFAAQVSRTPFTGRVFVIASKAAIKELPSRPNWLKPEPFFAWDVKDWKPGEMLVVRASDAAGLGFPHPLTKLPRREYSLQAVMDLDREGDPNPLASAGNAHSRPLRMEVDAENSGPVQLKIDQIYPARKFTETERIKLVDMASPLLSKFHGRPIRLRAGVILPESFAERKDQRYPVIYEIPGFSGTHDMAHIRFKQNMTDVAGVEAIWVVLDPNCRLGHHVFADSENNGPYGRALCEELIPFIEKTYRGLGKPQARLVTGHSSGGWSSLWLQVRYPDFFGGVWSTAPDPVDFRDFQKIDLYADKNMFTDEKGESRPLARRGGKVLLHYKPFSDMELVLGRGGQLFSFEAVFSPRGPDGKPQPLWDRHTGRIDPAVAQAWQKYDINLILKRGWKVLGPKLAGKIRIYMGAEDSFYLEGATLLLKKTLADLGSDAVVEIFRGKDHGSLVSRDLRQRISREMGEKLRQRGRADRSPTSAKLNLSGQ